MRKIGRNIILGDLIFIIYIKTDNKLYVNYD